ncbi:PAS domain S-box protein [Stenotrophomonas sp. MMGLT7]|uniref:sensor histidine kinase n=1 Tax=Stenotrophomonas sp. MMGLT7 TaxID=2901227 RepID=UPI001E4D5629|nr:PAS domain S-box protein [Stenotrophomonas sp. MMGLT7]
MRRWRPGVGWICAIYLLLGALWILLGDALIQAIASDPAAIFRLHTTKDLLYVVATALLLYLLLRPFVARATAARATQEQSEAAYRELFESSPSPMLAYDLQTLRILEANRAALAFFGWEREQLLGRTLLDLWPAQQAARMHDLVDAIRRDRAPRRLPGEELVDSQGRLRRVETQGNCIRYKGRLVRLVIVTDRSSEQEAQQRRDLAMARLEEAQVIARLGSWELDPASGLGRYSDQAYLILGRQPPSPPQAHRLQDLLVAADSVTQARIEALIDDIGRGHHLQIDVLLPLATPDLQLRTVHLRGGPVVQEDGSAIYRGTLQDVTEHEESRRLLHEREDQFRELVRVLPDGVLILYDERVIYANSACAAQFDHPVEALLGEPLRQLVAASDLDAVRGHLRQPPPDTVTARMHRADGSLFQAGLTLGEVRYSGRDCRLLVVRDLTEPERMRDALAAGNAELQAMARRLFSLQEDERRAISRDLHDDIGQAITAMKLSAHAAMEEDDDARRNEDLAEIGHLADATVGKLRNLSMLLRPPQLDALGLEAALRWQANMLFRASPVRLQVDIATLPQRPGKEAEQACFRIAQESLTNVLRHACAGEVRIGLDDEDGRGLRLQVSDDGDGFDPDGPRGLGLIIMRERAQAAGGSLNLHTAPGAGTRIELYLPYAALREHNPKEP